MVSWGMKCRETFLPKEKFDFAPDFSEKNKFDPPRTLLLWGALGVKPGWPEPSTARKNTGPCPGNRSLRGGFRQESALHGAAGVSSRPSHPKTKICAQKPSISKCDNRRRECSISSSSNAKKTTKQHRQQTRHGLKRFALECVRKKSSTMSGHGWTTVEEVHRRFFEAASPLYLFALFASLNVLNILQKMKYLLCASRVQHGG